MRFDCLMRRGAVRTGLHSDNLYGTQRARGTYRYVRARGLGCRTRRGCVEGTRRPHRRGGFVRSLPWLCSLCSPRLFGNSFRRRSSIPGGGEVLKGVGGLAYYTPREQLPGPHHTGAAVQTQPAARRGSNWRPRASSSMCVPVSRPLGSNVPGESMPQTRRPDSPGPPAAWRSPVRAFVANMNGGLLNGAAPLTSVHGRRRATLLLLIRASRAWVAATRWLRRRRPAARERCGSARGLPRAPTLRLPQPASKG